MLQGDPWYFHKHYSYNNYEKSKTIVNGKESWTDTQELYAIWYVPSNNRWIIGAVDYVGKDFGNFYALDQYSGLTDSKNKWYFKDLDGQWHLPNPFDITVVKYIDPTVFNCSHHHWTSGTGTL